MLDEVEKVPVSSDEVLGEPFGGRREIDVVGGIGLSQISDRTETLKNLLGQVRALEFRPEHVDLYKERRKRGEGTRRKKAVGEQASAGSWRAFGYAAERGA